MRMVAPNAAALGSSGLVPRLSGHDSVPPIGKIHTVRMAISMASQHVCSSELWMGVLQEYEAAAASLPSDPLNSNRQRGRT